MEDKINLFFNSQNTCIANLWEIKRFVRIKLFDFRESLERAETLNKKILFRYLTDNQMRNKTRNKIICWYEIRTKRVKSNKTFFIKGSLINVEN